MSQKRTRLNTEIWRSALNMVLGDKRPGWVVVIVLLFLLFFNWASSFLEKVLDLVLPGWLGALKLVFFVLLLLYIWLQARKEVAPLRVIAEEPSQVRAISIFLSLMETFPQGFPSSPEEASRLPPEEVKKALTGTKWEMPMIAVSHHYPTLKQLYVIPSADSKPGTKDGSFRQVPLFKWLFQRLFPKLEIETVSPEKGVDFEDIAALYDSLRESFLKKALSQYHSSQIIIDITGGQKPVAIAGVFATLDRDLKVQYVSTKTKKVTSYDLTYQGSK